MPRILKLKEHANNDILMDSNEDNHDHQHQAQARGSSHGTALVSYSTRLTTRIPSANLVNCPSFQTRGADKHGQPEGKPLIPPSMYTLWVRMSKYTTVSVKVPRQVKDKMEKTGIKWGPVLRQAIEDELQKAEREKAVDAILELAERAPKTEDNTAAKIIREMREEFAQTDNR
ncbi:hypothetical protein MUP00_02430 [Candidatus Bathyarchaeota archaeon]|nr:hypothetical protein [Candidatus Bathyarchaeota archaeon]